MDPYVYPNSSVLVNKLNIHDEQELISIEAQLLIAGLLNIESITNQLDFSDYNCLKMIHRFLFQDLYTWAGEFRTINIYKEERVLNGLSITYSDYAKIKVELETIFKWANKIDWSHRNPQLATDFADFMTEVWRIHPFREGNTRTVSIFMKLFAEANRLTFNAELLSQHAGYLREALVLAAVEEAPERQYLLRLIKDAFTIEETDELQMVEHPSEQYQTIGNYNVTKYEERPFKVEKD